MLFVNLNYYSYVAGSVAPGCVSTELPAHAGPYLHGQFVHFLCTQGNNQLLSVFIFHPSRILLPSSKPVPGSPRYKSQATAPGGQLCVGGVDPS